MSTPWISLSAALLLAPFVPAQWIHPYEPTPFRRGQLEGRDSVLNEMSFLHRLSFQPMPCLHRRGPLPDRTLRGTVGSIGSDKFYTHLEAKVDIPLEARFFAGYRFRRDEDADGPFDWNLLGFGRQFSDWRASVWADLEQDKALIDVHLDLEWHPENGSRVHLVFILPDMIHNRKSDTSTYDPKPYSVFLRGERSVSQSLSLNAFALYQNRTVLTDQAKDLRSENKASSGGLGFVWQGSPRMQVEFSAERLEGDRTREGITSPNFLDQTLDRTHQVLTLEARDLVKGQPHRWAGLRFLEFSERDHRPGNPVRELDTRREELTLYIGQRFPLSERWTLEPNLFAGLHEVRRLAPNDDDVRDLDGTGFYGKLAPRLDWIANRDTGATVSFTLMARLDKPAFGGGNVQVLFPF